MRVFLVFFGVKDTLTRTSCLAFRSRLPVLVSFAVSVAVVAELIVSSGGLEAGARDRHRSRTETADLHLDRGAGERARHYRERAFDRHRGRGIELLPFWPTGGHKRLLRGRADVIVAIGDHERTLLATGELEQRRAQRGIRDRRECRGQMLVIGHRGRTTEVDVDLTTQLHQQARQCPDLPATLGIDANALDPIHLPAQRPLQQRADRGHRPDHRLLRTLAPSHRQRTRTTDRWQRYPDPRRSSTATSPSTPWSRPRHAAGSPTPPTPDAHRPWPQQDWSASSPASAQTATSHSRWPATVTRHWPFGRPWRRWWFGSSWVQHELGVRMNPGRSMLTCTRRIRNGTPSRIVGNGSLVTTA